MGPKARDRKRPGGAGPRSGPAPAWRGRATAAALAAALAAAGYAAWVGVAQPQRDYSPHCSSGLFGRVHCASPAALRAAHAELWAASKAEAAAKGRAGVGEAVARERQRLNAAARDLHGQGLLSGPELEPLPRVAAAALSPAEFVERYAAARRPVILEGLREAVTGGGWDLDWVLGQCGDRQVKPREYQPGVDGWASQEEAAEYIGIASVLDHGPAARRPYVVDWSLPWGCPWALENFSVPGIFAGDALRILPEKYWHLRDKWPSLFLGGEGTRTGLHTDALGTHFWQLVLGGEKEWTVLRHGDAHLVQDWVPEKYHVFAYGADPWALEADAQRSPLLRLARGWRGVAREGDVVFAPAEAPHAVRNLGNISLAVSMNYIGADNVETAATHARSGEYGESFSPAFADELLRAAERLGDSSAEPVSWARFKGYPAGHVVASSMARLREKHCPKGAISDRTAKDKGLPYWCPWDWAALPDPGARRRRARALHA
eukprot:TRINITY_DN25700_c0_g1_i2.p1 TRINITY_DN25700_c0_g1~~TRINITY_DN25700_c0_g1_i2.p1  ORF type:complete len:511 (+),score=132.93 TRINITY_DN25700_c0_g1_i2:64-1533(+)